MSTAISFSENSPEHENEDFFLLEQLPGTSQSWIGAVADGQGGRAGGAPAAQLACRTILNAAFEVSVDWLARPDKWRDLFLASDKAVQADSRAGFTTLTAFCIADGYVYGASCGDGAAYLCNTKAQFIELTASQQKNPQIGSGMTSCTFFRSPLVKPWALLVVTDGVWKYVGLEKIRALLENTVGKSLGIELETVGRLPGSGKFSDDFTFVLIESDP